MKMPCHKDYLLLQDSIHFALFTMYIKGYTIFEWDSLSSTRNPRLLFPFMVRTEDTLNITRGQSISCIMGSSNYLQI